MSEPYTFEYEGVRVEYQRGTVRMGIEATRMRRKLVAAYGYTDTMPSDEYDNIDEYSSAMSRTKTSAAWWGHSNMDEGQLKQAFELFLDQDEELYELLRRAYSATYPPKKTVMSP